MWEALLEFFEVVPVVIPIILLVIVFVVGLLYIKSWLKDREFNDDKRHWRE